MADSRFTSTALGAIRLAQENAVRLGHCYVGSEHLLLGLACQEYSLAARLLGEAGADSRSLRAAVVQLVGAGAPGPTLRQGLTPRCCQVIRRAAEECRRLGGPAVGAEHLLLGVLLEPDSSAARLLGACEVDREGLRRAVHAALGGEEGVPRPIRSREPERVSGDTRQLDQCARDLTRMAAEGRLDPVIGREEELDRVISQAGRAVSSLMNYPAYVAATGKKQMTARRFELLPVDEHSCIVVMMMGDNRVKSQLLRMQLKVDTEQMPTLVNLLNSNFTGISADEMNRRLMDVSEQVTPQMFLLLSQTIAYAADVLQEAGQKEVFTVGTSQLLKLPEFRDADKAHQLMSFLSDSKESLPMPEDGPMKILIGPENVTEALKDTSVVVASYDIGNDMRGLIGVVGPTRMDYGTVAARLSGFAEGLTRLFGKQELPPKEDAKE